MTLMTIGEFAERTRLSPRALRLYDRLGLVVPAHVDASPARQAPGLLVGWPLMVAVDSRRHMTRIDRDHGVW